MARRPGLAERVGGHVPDLLAVVLEAHREGVEVVLHARVDDRRRRRDHTDAPAVAPEREVVAAGVVGRFLGHGPSVGVTNAGVHPAAPAGRGP